MSTELNLTFFFLLLSSSRGDNTTANFILFFYRIASMFTSQFMNFDSDSVTLLNKKSCCINHGHVERQLVEETYLWQFTVPFYFHKHKYTLRKLVRSFLEKTVYICPVGRERYPEAQKKIVIMKFIWAAMPRQLCVLTKQIPLNDWIYYYLRLLMPALAKRIQQHFFGSSHLESKQERILIY